MLNYIWIGLIILGIFVAVGNDIRSAVKAAYATVENIHFEGAHYRRDVSLGGRSLTEVGRARLEQEIQQIVDSIRFE